ncbi:MAG: hypothetical protein U9R79_06200 [Armatimonadota bacterium]|nr:hypothetical protein [Armatimonadota bacterium]
MPVQLRNADGYYAATVEIDGTTFRIADLSEHYDEFVDRYTALRAETGVDELDEFDAEALVKLAVEQSRDANAMKRVRKNIEQLLDWMLDVALVSWDIAGAECTAETRRLLPPRVKSELAQAIFDESQLTLGEANFLGGLRNAAGGRE